MENIYNYILRLGVIGSVFVHRHLLKISRVIKNMVSNSKTLKCLALHGISGENIYGSWLF
jgi:hypothetical protein